METQTYRNLASLQPGKSPSELVLVNRDGSRRVLPLDTASAHHKLDTLFQEWILVDAETAHKAAFDYSSEERAMKWIWLVLSVFMVGGLGTLFLTDGLHTRHCTGLLQDTGQIATAQVSKVKKDRRGQWLWDMGFVTANGQSVHGRRPGQNIGPDGGPAGNPTVIYAPSDLSCWDVSVRPGTRQLPSAARWFNEKFTGGFGLFFVLAGLLSSALSLRALRDRRPYREVVSKYVYDRAS